MKSPVAYYLMLLYLTVMLKPLFPVLSDFWSHEFNEIEHISIVHAKYGSNHLQKEVADTESDRNSQKNQNTLRTEDQIPFHIATAVYSPSFDAVLADKVFFVFLSPKLSPVSISRQGPPPKFS